MATLRKGDLTGRVGWKLRGSGLRQSISTVRASMKSHGIAVSETPYTKVGDTILRRGLESTMEQSARAAGEAALNAVLASIQDALAAGDRVVLTGFGSFSVREVKARRVRQIRGGGALIAVPAHKRVGFTAGRELNKAAQS